MKNKYFTIMKLYSKLINMYSMFEFNLKIKISKLNKKLIVNDELKDVLAKVFDWT